MSEIAHSQFFDSEQRQDASRLGMWIFLATEVMLFGGLFAAYTCFHALYPQAFIAASHQADFWLGAGNTAVLLLSSLSMALAVESAKTGEQRSLVRYLLLTIVLGTVFLALKGVEYHHHFQDHLFPGPGFQFDPHYAGPAKIFFSLYFAMTGLHALHMIVGMIILSIFAFYGRRGKFTTAYYTPIELMGLYWHFVDVIWLFLFPLFYLSGGH